MRFQQGKKTFMMVGLALLVLAIGAAGYYAKSYYELRDNPNKVAEGETKHLTDLVGKLYQLPADETPIVGKVKDREKLNDQPFFKNAQNDDDILIYQKAKVAIIYRATENKLINVGPVALDSSPQSGQVSATVKVVNASAKQDMTGDAIRKIGEVAGFTVDQNVTDAKKKNLTKTIVVDAAGTKAEQAKQIATKLGGEVGSLPAGESAPSTDIVVFVGAQ